MKEALFAADAVFWGRVAKGVCHARLFVLLVMSESVSSALGCCMQPGLMRPQAVASCRTQGTGAAVCLTWHHAVIPCDSYIRIASLAKLLDCVEEGAHEVAHHCLMRSERSIPPMHIISVRKSGCRYWGIAARHV